MKDTRTGSVP